MAAVESPLLAAAGIAHGFGTRDDAPPPQVATARQVHGERGLGLRGGADPTGEEADALATDEARWVAVRTADCVPVLVADRRGGRVAAVHAGWRGSFARIAARAVESLLRDGARVEDLVAAIGPRIGACCYEVSAELAEGFARAFGTEVRQVRRLDLGRVNLRTLEAAGLARSQVDIIEACTFCDHRFHSFRRDGAAAGRQFSFVRGGSLS